MKHIVIFGVLALATTACGRNTPAEPEPAPAAQEVKQEAHAHETEHGPMQTPFVLTLGAPTELADGKELEVVATLLLDRPSKDPIALTFTLPEGATLLSGQDKEVLKDLPSGKLGRTWRLALTKPVSEDNPLIVSADLRPEHDAYGAHAERRFPVAAPNVRRSPAVRPPPGRPPLPPALRAGVHRGDTPR